REHSAPRGVVELTGARGARRRLRARTELAPRLGEEEPRAVEIAARKPRRGRDLLRPRTGIVGLRLAGEPALDHLRGERPEADRLAARDDRLEQHRRLRAHEHQMRERGWVLERLQERVLALVAHRLGRLDHEHAPRALERAVRGAADDAVADLLD